GLAERTYDSFAPKQASAQIKMTGRWPVIFQQGGSRISSRRPRASVRVDQCFATGIRAGIALEVVAIDRRGVAAFEVALRLKRIGLHVPCLVSVTRERGRGNNSDEGRGERDLGVG